MPTATQERQAPSVSDRRSRRTCVALRDALAEEIQATGDLSQVTVTAVTDRADVTRRTFYSHYRDISDLVRSVENEMLQEMRPYVDRICQTNLDELERSIDEFSPCPGTIEFLDYVKRNGSWIAALLGDGGDPSFTKRLCDMAHEQARDRVAEGFVLPSCDVLIDYYLTFVISAEVGVLERWLSGGMHEPVGVVARMMTALLFVRPGDLYGRPIGFDIASTAPVLAAKGKELLNG